MITDVDAAGHNAQHVGEIGLVEVPAHVVSGDFGEKGSSSAVDFDGLHVNAGIIDEFAAQGGGYGICGNHGEGHENGEN